MELTTVYTSGSSAVCHSPTYSMVKDADNLPMSVATTNCSYNKNNELFYKSVARGVVNDCITIILTDEEIKKSPGINFITSYSIYPMFILAKDTIIDTVKNSTGYISSHGVDDNLLPGRVYDMSLVGGAPLTLLFEWKYIDIHVAPNSRMNCISIITEQSERPCILSSTNSTIVNSAIGNVTIRFNYRNPLSSRKGILLKYSLAVTSTTEIIPNTSTHTSTLVASARSSTVMTNTQTTALSATTLMATPSSTVESSGITASHLGTSTSQTPAAVDNAVLDKTSKNILDDPNFTIGFAIGGGILLLLVITFFAVYLLQRRQKQRPKPRSQSPASANFYNEEHNYDSIDLIANSCHNGEDNVYHTLDDGSPAQPETAAYIGPHEMAATTPKPISDKKRRFGLASFKDDSSALKDVDDNSNNYRKSSIKRNSEELYASISDVFMAARPSDENLHKAPVDSNTTVECGDTMEAIYDSGEVLYKTPTSDNGEIEMVENDLYEPTSPSVGQSA
ncbi:uncharacterized protein [Watersipora subatra]